MTGTPDSIPLPEGRLDLEALIEAAISRLDEMESDPDLEEGGDDEPILGAPEARTGSWSGLYPEASADERELDTADDEPELGSLEHMNQRGWAGGGDGEPSLGSLASFTQCAWGNSSTRDFEDEHDGAEPCCEDEGAQCEDEGADVDFVLVPPQDDVDWRHWQAQRAATTKAAIAIVDSLRTVMKHHGRRPVDALRVLGDAILKR